MLKRHIAKIKTKSKNLLLESYQWTHDNFISSINHKYHLRNENSLPKNLVPHTSGIDMDNSECSFSVNDNNNDCKLIKKTHLVHNKLLSLKAISPP